MIGIKVNNWGLALKLYEGDKSELKNYVEFEVRQFEKRLNDKLRVKTCERCGKEYISLAKNTVYCDRKGPDGITCREIGSIAKMKDPSEINKVYKKHYAVMYGKMKHRKPSWKYQDMFDEWKELANDTRDKANSSEISVEEFKRHMEEIQTDIRRKYNA